MIRHYYNQNVKKLFKPTKLLNRKVVDPEVYVYTGDESADPFNMQVFAYNQQQLDFHEPINPDVVSTFSDYEKTFWLNTYGFSDPQAIRTICEKLNVHSLTIQDILDLNQRPKFEEFEDHCFITIKSTVPNSFDKTTEQISFILGKNFLVSFQERRADYFKHLRQRLHENKGIVRQRGPDYLLFTMLESILDNYFKTLHELETDSVAFDLLNEDKDISPQILKKIEDISRQVYSIKKAILPIKEITLTIEREEISFIEQRHLKYFLELKDLCLTLLDTCETIENNLESNTNLFFSIQSHKMNQVMKTLTVVSTIFIPLTFIVGIYGMNFTYMPELDWKYGYPSVWILMLMVVGGMWLFFRRKRWF
jgi:magnesium transporter